MEQVGTVFLFVIFLKSGSSLYKSQQQNKQTVPVGATKTTMKQHERKNLVLHQTEQSDPEGAQRSAARPTDTSRSYYTPSRHTRRATFTSPREAVLPTPREKGENRNSPGTQRSAGARGRLPPAPEPASGSRACRHGGTFSRVKPALTEALLGTARSTRSP